MYIVVFSHLFPALLIIIIIALHHHRSHLLILLSVCVVMVVGAGSRGPLVTCVIQAASRCGEQMVRRVRLYVVEKNPNAMVTLAQQPQENPVWKEFMEGSTLGAKRALTIFLSDMRSLHEQAAHNNPLEKADFLVSELLGSFGDNELSPECLDGALPFLKPIGKSIPASSTSYVTPITTDKLYRAIEKRSTAEGFHKAFETPYVVKLTKIYDGIALEPRPIWTFHHRPSGATLSPKANERYCVVDFDVLPQSENQTALVHGFAGYFSSDLFVGSDKRGNADQSDDEQDSVVMSILPSTFSKDMCSWFPIYFPSREPVLVRSGDQIKFLMSRNVDTEKKRIWYEWTFQVVDKATGRMIHQSPTHNPDGRSCWIGL